MPPLKSRDANITMTPNVNHKRKQDVVDLTGDDLDDDTPSAKAQRSSQDTAPQRPNGRYDGPRSSQTTSLAPSSSASSYFPGSQSHWPMPGSQQHSEAEREAWLDADDDDNDMNEIISSTQNEHETSEMQLYGELPTKIVGVQYYRGMASPGELILMRREPGNPYDRNAIRIDNVGGQQIGHIPKRVAEKLARYMDNRWAYFEGRLAGRVGQFDCPLEVKIFGPDPRSDAGKQLAANMIADKLPTKALKEAERQEKQLKKDREQAEKKRLAEARRNAAAGGGRGGRLPKKAEGSQFANHTEPGVDSTPVLDDILEASQRFNPRAMSSTADTYGMQEDVLSSMPMAKKPEGIKTEMLPYQLQALQWLLDQESPQVPSRGTRESTQLWQRHETHLNAFTNIATNYSTEKDPVLASGGILADDMGLGKTLEMISLIITDAACNGRGTTLVVAPLSVMSNWSGQIAQHVHESSALKVYTYHAAGRVKMSAKDFSQYDVVITTYQTLASDFMPRGKGAKAPEKRLRANGLYSMDWRRVILDEGHTVRNPASKGAAAVMGVMAKSRWVLTGTPIVNSLKDLYCLLRIIGISGGLESLEVFNSVLVRPLKKGAASATLLLQAVMNAFTLRRKKEMKFIDLKLPKLDEYLHRIEFTSKERERYEALEKEAKGLLKNFIHKSSSNGDSRSKAYQTLLEILLRMRQCCNHWQLCKERVTNLMAQLEEVETVAPTPENKRALQDMLSLQIQNQEDCPVCLEGLATHSPVITTCAHAFGLDCITRVIEGQHRCPMCRAALPDLSLLLAPANENGDEGKDEDMDLKQSSSKLEAMMSILHATKKSRKGDKTIIFSQWTRFLDVIQARLDSEGFKYCRLDGTMPAQDRDAALQSLENDEECTIMLASLGVCAVGLNLIAANQIILSDTWWAPAIEDQAVDRVHRLGQKKETRVFRLIMDKSIEETTIEIQKDKRKLMKLAFSEKESKRDKVKQGRLADIQKLLG